MFIILFNIIFIIYIKLYNIYIYLFKFLELLLINDNNNILYNKRKLYLNGVI